jgi:hypothetical protein
VDFTYRLRGDAQPGPRPVGPREQHAALDALLDCLDSEVLLLPDRILNLIPPRPFGYPSHRELFDNRTGGTLDAVTIAESAGEPVILFLLNSRRAARLMEQHARDVDSPGLREVIDALVDRTFHSGSRDRVDELIAIGLRYLVTDELMRLAQEPSATPAVRAEAYAALARLADELHRGVLHPWKREAIDRIMRFRTRPEAFEFPPRPTLPPGSPIGTEFCSQSDW